MKWGREAIREANASFWKKRRALKKQLLDSLAATLGVSFILACPGTYSWLKGPSWYLPLLSLDIWYVPPLSARREGERERKRGAKPVDSVRASLWLCGGEPSFHCPSKLAGRLPLQAERRPIAMEYSMQGEAWKAQTLKELIEILHRLFASDKVNVAEVQTLMESYESNPEEWTKYAQFDQFRYTRNLIDKGNGKFNLMILCWGEGHGSSIHDHTDSHCFMKLLQGNLKETLFEWPGKKGVGEMLKKSERVLKRNQCAYINDSIGLHRVENPSHTETAVSLHLYSPPFEICQTFDQRTGHKQKVKMTFYSQFGERTPYTSAVSQENN